MEEGTEKKKKQQRWCWWGFLPFEEKTKREMSF